MNTKKLIFKISLLSGLFLISSCKKDFLNEELKTQRNLEFFKTDEGIQALAAGSYYQVLSRQFDGEWIYCATNYGVDEFGIGGDPSNVFGTIMMQASSRRLPSIMEILPLPTLSGIIFGPG